MPKINKVVTITNLDQVSISNALRESLTEMGGQNIKVELNRVSAFMPSVWGWGGMDIDAIIESNQGSTVLNVGGYIGQLSTSPLKKVVDELITRTTNLLKEQFKEGVIISEISSVKTSYNTKDKNLIIVVIVMVVILGTLEALSGKNLSILFMLPILYAGYTLGKKFLYKNRS